VRRAEPERLIVAVGVAPQRTLTQLREAADEVICLAVPEMFVAVGQAFREFGPVTDEDIIRILRSAREA
jgi:predicted phosphoribosyltransferase